MRFSNEFFDFVLKQAYRDSIIYLEVDLIQSPIYASCQQIKRVLSLTNMRSLQHFVEIEITSHTSIVINGRLKGMILDRSKKCIVVKQRVSFHLGNFCSAVCFAMQNQF